MESIVEKLQLKDIDKSTWKKYKFDQIAKNISERVEPSTTDLEIYVGLEHIDSESIHIKRFGKREDVNGTKLRCYPGDVIFGRRRAYQRKAAIVEFDGFCSAHSLVLRANPEVIHPKLFPFFLHSDTFMHRAVDISVGSLSPTINWGDLKKQEFILPPKEQQEQIAELLWAGDEAAEKYYAVTDSKSKLKMSMLSSYFKHAKKTIRLSEMGKVVTGSTPATKKCEYWGGNIPFVTPADIDDSPYVNKTERFVTELGAEVSRAIPENAVLTVCIGSTIGKVSITNQMCVTNQQINAIIPKPEFQPEFILYTLRFFKGKIMEKVGATAVPIINKSEFESIELPLLELIDRKEMVQKVKAIDQAIVRSSEQLAYFLKVQKSLINQIF